MSHRRNLSQTGQFLYDLRYRLGEYSLRAFVALLPCIPYRLLLLFTSVMARLTFSILWKYRTRMEENVAIGLGATITQRADRKALVWRAWKNFAYGILETSCVTHFPKEKIIATMALTG